MQPNDENKTVYKKQGNTFVKIEEKAIKPTWKKFPKKVLKPIGVSGIGVSYAITLSDGKNIKFEFEIASTLNEYYINIAKKAMVINLQL